jgi:large subunit ribosomal protein L25
MKIVAYERNLQGTGASRRLRNAGKVPGIVYGGDKPRMIELDHNALFQALKKESFHSSLLEMELGASVQKVLLRDFQMHAWKQQVMHVDFQRVDESTRIHMKVPLHYSGEENSPAVKTDHCLISHVANEIEVECLATQLPEFIAVDLSHLVKGQSLHVSDVKVPEGIKVVRHGTRNPVIVAVTLPKIEEEEVPAEAAAAALAPGAAPATAVAGAAPAAATAAGPAATPAPAKGGAKAAPAKEGGKDAKASTKDKDSKKKK